MPGTDADADISRVRHKGLAMGRAFSLRIRGERKPGAGMERAFGPEANVQTSRLTAPAYSLQINSSLS